MGFTDIHCHMLACVDDGAKTEEDMYRMLDAAYGDGASAICLTPHYHPGYFGENGEAAERAFALLQSYASARYPGLQLFLGNELRYSPDCIYWLSEGRCRTMNQTRHVLVDFSEQDSERTIVTGIEQLLNTGYIPVLAHAERYRNLDAGLRRLQELHENGVLMQMDVQALFGGFGLRAQRRSKAMLAAKLVDFISSDAHDCTERPPGLARGYGYIAKRYGREYAEDLCSRNAWRLLQADTDSEEGNREHGS